jgi:toxin FitB
LIGGSALFIVDTNVISETLRPEPNKKVMAALRKIDGSKIFTTSVTAAELLFGVETMPPGAARNRLGELIRIQLDSVFSGRVLAFQPSAARHYARIGAHRKSIGKPIMMADALIAAIGADYRYAVVTGDKSGFIECGIEVINPWTD